MAEKVNQIVQMAPIRRPDPSPGRNRPLTVPGKIEAPGAGLKPGTYGGALQLGRENDLGIGVYPVVRQVIEAAAPAAQRLAGLLITALLRPLRAIAAIPGHPLLRLFVGEVHAVTLRVFAYGCVLAAMGLMAVEVATMQRGAVVAEAPTPEWTEVGKLFPAFAITMPEFDEAPRYAIWRHPNGGGRKDLFTFGDAAAGGATAMVEIYRPGAEPDPEADVVTASIPELRLSGRPVAQTALETKFGQIAIDPFTDSAPGGERGCLRFWRAFDEPKLEISGWYCNAGQELVDRGMIACSLDRLTLVAARSEPKIGALFAQAEQKRNFCGANNVFLAATRKRNDWIEATRDPRLRGAN
jgi:hypothetical protein